LIKISIPSGTSGGFRTEFLVLYDSSGRKSRTSGHLGTNVDDRSCSYTIYRFLIYITLKYGENMLLISYMVKKYI